MKFSSFVGNAIVYAAGIGTGVYLFYKGLKFAAMVMCDEPKVEKTKRDQVILVDPIYHENECAYAYFATHRSAEEALDKLQKIIDMYGFATTSDLHYVAYIKNFDADDNRGWKDLSESEIVKTGELYRLRLEKPVEIDT